MLDFLELPERPEKPRETGLTHVLDPGLGTGQACDRLDACGEFVDIVKLGWGTGYVTECLPEKVALYQEYGIPVCFGGTLFELAALQGQVEEYVDALADLGVDHVEVSTGVIEMDHDRKCELIDDLSEDFVVLSEIGRKDSEEGLSPQEWSTQAARELDAGAWKVVTEGRSSGTTGVYDAEGGVRSELIDGLTAEIAADRILFEAPRKDQQIWFIEELSPSVNLGNIDMTDVIPLETLRQGLRSDTLHMIHSDERTTHEEPTDGKTTSAETPSNETHDEEKPLRSAPRTGGHRR
ncbi:competence protein ComA [Halobacteriales archaeon QS_3_64_16]|nr:MAG: competence protein ComA [Halobacteriales archaeon QS_3_64_16]